MNALVLTAAIAVVWGALLGIAYLARFIFRQTRTWSVFAVMGGYVALSAAALAWLGLTQSGGLGVFGMLLPFTAAIGLVLLAPSR